MDIKEFERIYRHGDVILFKLKADDLNSGKASLRKANGCILEVGEVTGHAHRLDGEIDILEEEPAEKTIIFKVAKKAILTHEEHDCIVLEEGIYLKVSQVEYDPFRNMINWIRD